MPNDYYKLPLRLDLIIQGANLRQNPVLMDELMCSVDASLQDHVYLIITTQFREARYDPQFGCTIWEEEFNSNNDWNDTRWTDRIQMSIREGIQQHEKRLSRVNVLVHVDREGSTDAHKRLIIEIKAEIRKSNHREFTFQREILIAPFSAQRRR